MIIQSRSNIRVRRMAALKDKKFRREYGEYLVEGIKMVTECIEAGCEVTSVMCTPEYASVSADAVVVTRDVFEYISDEKSPQGVIASVKIPRTPVSAPEDRCILLDGLQDPGNVGTIIRTANAAGFGEIYLVGCADPYSPKSVRASMSGVFFTKLMRCTADEALDALRDVPLVSADMDGENVFGFNAPDKFCLCIGNEGSGLSQKVRSASAYTVRVPMRSTCESLNAAVSAGILMYVINGAKL